jgi:membrane protease YdiL (CAAX protease family)
MNYLLKQLIAGIAAFAFIYIPFAWCRWRKENPDTYGLSWQFNKRSLAECLILTAIVLGTLTAVSINWPFETLPRHSSLGRTLNLAAGGIGAAIIEEIFYRGWLQQIFKKKLPVFLAVILTSAIFASSHVFVAQTPFMIAVFFPGCVMGFLREKHGNISTSTLFHGISNLWAIWLSPLSWPTMDWILRNVL